LITSTLLTLFVLPTLYKWLEEGNSEGIRPILQKSEEGKREQK